MSIRLKILSGFIILASLLIISGLISIYELTKLGNSVNKLLRDNYLSIDYARQMSHSLEKQNSAILLAVAGDKGSASDLFGISVKEFKENFEKAATNLTQPDEKTLTDSISLVFNSYRQATESFIASSNASLNEYITTIRPMMETIQNSVDNLLLINQQALTETAAILKNSPYRTIMPGLIVIITSVVFSMLFYYMISYYFVKPVIGITKGINDFIKYKRPFEVAVDTKDEVNELKEAVKNLTTLKNTPR
ncbi:MAG TPA: MCP four helix bundle domain-containing protein [Tenuifilaceae bacterium]|jgi:hypothetical protein|nr:hypothetical protein [Bacteroidales bacterium]HNT40631.1 MCP four helix bundle domain-containing protein [Tenuifilaceae bacterium]HOA08982.1 MCP four helix bundle domain-containing protein [Tenuifilaceae bacterium]HOC36485.1 MCP four helix bundle domain-containing protein [Tenuifilaceae bacterium]HOG72174.1 MCP four helix bundle domain-containing protein [Tenuifilaceae bacterium]